MNWANSRESYGWATIILHWVAAVGVVFMFVTGLRAGLAGQAGDTAARGALMALHVSAGATLFLFFAARIALHYAQPRPAKPVQARWLNTLAVVTQNVLLIALAIQIISGPLAVWSGGRPINIFGLLSVPSPFASRAQGVHEVAEVAHLIGRSVIFFVLPLHVLGALKHLVLDRDGVFTRMLWPSPLKRQPPV